MKAAKTMKTEKTDKTTDKKQQETELLNTIGHKIIAGLGKPPRFLDVQVKPLYEELTGHRLRANVLVETDIPGELHIGQCRIAHSYFVTASDDGTIVACLPQLTRIYQPQR